MFPRKAKNGRNSLVTNEPENSSLLGKLKQRSWEFGEWLRKPQVRYALKTGIGGGESGYRPLIASLTGQLFWRLQRIQKWGDLSSWSTEENGL